MVRHALVVLLLSCGPSTTPTSPDACADGWYAARCLDEHRVLSCSWAYSVERCDGPRGCFVYAPGTRGETLHCDRSFAVGLPCMGDVPGNWCASAWEQRACTREGVITSKSCPTGCTATSSGSTLCGQ